MSRQTYRRRFAPQIDALIRQGHTLADREGRRAFRELWESWRPRVGASWHWPYRCLRHEIRVQLGLVPRSTKRPAWRSGLQLVLPGVAEEQEHGERDD